MIKARSEARGGPSPGHVVPGSLPVCSIVIPTYNGRELLKRCLASIKRHRPIERGHGQPAACWAGRPVEEVFGASGSSAFYRAEALRRAGGLDPLFGSYYEDIDLAFRLRWAGYRCVFTPHCRVDHDVSATYDHGSPALQRRMARNAELVFWSHLPAGMLALAAGP